MQICSHLQNKFLRTSSFFPHWFVQVNRLKTTVKKKIIYFWKIMLLLYSQFSKRSLQMFHHLVFKCKVLRSFVFYLFEVQSTVLERNFYDIFIKLQKLFAKKYLILVRSGKLIPWILRFYTRCKMHITPVLLKNYSFHNFLNRSNFAFICCFSKKKFSPQKMFMSYLRLRHCAYLNSASNVLAYLLIIILRRDWFGFFLNKWGCIRSTP